MAAYYYPADPNDDGFCIKDPSDVGTLVSLRAAAGELGVGDTTNLVATMDAPVEVDTDIMLTAADPTALDVPPVVRIPAHAQSATVTVRGLRPAAAVGITAALGGQTISASLAVRGLLLSELLVRPDPSGSLAGQGPWIEIANVSGQPIDLQPYRLALSGAGDPDVDVALAGTLEPHGCLVVTASVPPLMDRLTPTMTGLPNALPAGMDGPVTVNLVDPVAASPLDTATYDGTSGGVGSHPGTSLLRLTADRWEQAVVPTPGICEIRP